MLSILICFLSDLTNIGMLFDMFGVALIAIYGIPKNNDATLLDNVTVEKKGEELQKTKQLIAKLKRIEFLGFLLIFFGFFLMLVDRNLA